MWLLAVNPALLNLCFTEALNPVSYLIHVRLFLGMLGMAKMDFRPGLTSSASAASETWARRPSKKRLRGSHLFLTSKQLRIARTPLLR